jgi:hypothetical protein
MPRKLLYHERTYRLTRITCDACGKASIVERPNAKWCSDRCRMRRKRDQARPDRVTCPACGLSRAPDDFAQREGKPVGACRLCRRDRARLRRIQRARSLIVCVACKVARPAAAFAAARSLRCRLCRATLMRQARAAGW